MNAQAILASVNRKMTAIQTLELVAQLMTMAKDKLADERDSAPLDEECVPYSITLINIVERHQKEWNDVIVESAKIEREYHFYMMNADSE